jgi:hypothetical protein
MHACVYRFISVSLYEMRIAQWNYSKNNSLEKSQKKTRKKKLRRWNMITIARELLLSYSKVNLIDNLTKILFLSWSIIMFALFSLIYRNDHNASRVTNKKKKKRTLRDRTPTRPKERQNQFIFFLLLGREINLFFLFHIANDRIQ